MLKNINYLCFDLETTWLNIQKDEPIQIWIVKFDNNFNIIKEYKSYINPKKDIVDLKWIVKFITNINMSDLRNSPYIEDIIPEIYDLFDENTVLIWHNINFDISILSKYMEIKNFWIIDTYFISKTLFHFLPSYSLEVIAENLRRNYWINIDSNYHDALTDSKVCMNIFKVYIEELSKLFKKYPTIPNIILKSNTIYNDILDLEDYSNNIDSYYLPWLKKEVKNSNKLISWKNSFEWYENFDKFYVWDKNIKDVILNILYRNKKCILCFSSVWKLKLVRWILNSLWIKNIWFLWENYIFDTDNVKKFLSKSSFNFDEVNFLVKYYFQFDMWHNMLDISLPWDFKILKYLQKNIDKKLPDVVLWLHSSLFNLIKNWKNFPAHEILFFDRDVWYNSFSYHINKPFDLYNILNLLDYIIYKSDIDWINTDKLSDFRNYFTIFMWIIYKEITSKFKNTSKNLIEIDPILDNIDFFKTNEVFSDIFLKLNDLKLFLSDEDFLQLDDLIKDLKWILDNICLIKKNMFNEDDFYFTFYRTNNVINYNEFIDSLGSNNVIFVTNFTKERSKKLFFWEDYSNKINLNIKKRASLIDNIKLISENEKIFILSTSKEKSKEIFDELLLNNFNNEYSILAENITWWLWKNIFNAKNSNKMIVIWWFEFLINLFAEKINFDIINVYSASGPYEKQIINDIIWYWNSV